MSILQLDPFREIERWLGEQSFWRTPSSVPMDAYRRDGRLEVDFDVPGIDPSSIELTVEQNTLAVKAERASSAEAEAELVIAERPTGSFTRQVILGEQLDTEHVEASYHDGVLHVTIPVAERATARKIEIGSGAASAIGTGTGTTD